MATNGIQDHHYTEALGYDTALVLGDAEMDAWQEANRGCYYDAELHHDTDTWRILVFLDAAMLQPVYWVQPD